MTTEEKWHIDKFHMYLTAIWWGILLVTSMCLMITTAVRKTIVIAEGSYEQESAGGVTAAREKEVPLAATEEGTRIFLIPLEKDIKAENVVVENSYMKREMHIFIKGAKEEFYEENSVTGDVANILWAGGEKQRNGVFLNLHMDGIYEYRTSMDGEHLRIETCDPHEIYDMLVVVDCMESEQRERTELAAAVCRLLPKQLNHEKIRLYFTNSEEETPSVEERLAFVEEVRPDLFLSVGVAVAEDTSLYGIRGWYNENYFIPEFGNVEFADIVTRKVTIASGNRAIGLQSAADDSILQEIRVPAAGVELGYLTNEQERVLLSHGSYREKLARGIAEALREVYTDYYEQQR